MNTANFFKNVYEQSQGNSILIMDTGGAILEVSASFTKHYGYTSADLEGKSFKLLFTPSDRARRLPEKELQKVNATGQSNDDNQVVDKNGISKRSSGESVLVSTPKGEKYIVKMIVNLHAKKYLRLFFLETDKLLQRTLTTTEDFSIMVLDPNMKILRINRTFLNLFQIKEPPARGSGLSSLQHPFWKREDVKQLIRSTIVTNLPLKRKRFELLLPNGGKKKIAIDSKIIETGIGRDKKVFILVDELP